MNEIELNVEGTTYRLTNQNNNDKYGRAIKDAGSGAKPKQVLAYYDKHGANIQNEAGEKINNGQFWKEEELR
ncbi:MAG: hypothetical protein AAB895_04155, partial [Patescibacteria group bacterium]